MIGLVLGLAAGGFFAAGSVMARFGQRHRAADDGVLMSILVNVIALAVVGLTVETPEWHTAGAVALMSGGVLSSVLGRTASLRGVRLIGATRSSAFMTASPFAAAIAGWLVLGEGVTLLEGAGGLLVVLGLLALVMVRSDVQPAHADAATVSPRLGYLIAAAAPVFFGLGFVVKKWGLIHFPSAVLGALLGSTAALVVVVAGDLVTGRLRRRVRDNFVDVPWWFVGAGVAMTGALLSQFAAFAYLPAWLVGVLQGTQALWALLFGWLFLRRDEQLDGRVVLAVVLVVGGVALIGIAR